MKHSLLIRLPGWASLEHEPRAGYRSDERMMDVAIRLARRNVREKTGGPFGAAVISARGELITVGVTCLVAQSCSVAHAEIMAIMLAQRALGDNRMGAASGERYVLASSAQPCAMCVGALGWSGVKRILFGARRADVQGIAGFDEGPLAPDWKTALRSRGLAIRGDVLRADACEALKRYAANGGMVY